jgi:histidyl-tRNA synthetase
MKKFNTSPISGMQELTPAKQAIFDKLKNEIAGVYHSHGFLSIETPIIDRTEILLAKAGGDTEKQIYKVVKTAETEGDADQALRFDHTVPLARYVVEHENDITFPFKVTQIGRNFRGERAQKGRFREFYQLDVDVIGREKLAIEYDAEVVKTAYDALKTFIKPEMKIRISNRKILSGLLQELGLETKAEDIFGIIDHAEKVPKEKTISAFEEIGLNGAEIEKLTSFMAINGSRENVITALTALGINNDIFALGVEELDKVLGLLEKQGLGDTAIGDMLIIRGLDYYTGSVFETFLPEYREIGSICSGGRYENLASNYTENKFPGVGIQLV